MPTTPQKKYERVYTGPTSLADGQTLAYLDWPGLENLPYLSPLTKFPNPLGNIFGLNMKSLPIGNFQLFSFKTEIGC